MKHRPVIIGGTSLTTVVALVRDLAGDAVGMIRRLNTKTHPAAAFHVVSVSSATTAFQIIC